MYRLRYAWSEGPVHALSASSSEEAARLLFNNEPKRSGIFVEYGHAKEEYFSEDELQKLIPDYFYILDTLEGQVDLIRSVLDEEHDYIPDVKERPGLLGVSANGFLAMCWVLAVVGLLILIFRLAFA